MKLIIDIPDEVLSTRHYCLYFGAWSTKLTETIENGIPYEEKPQGEWIPVSERLPEKGNQSYLVTVDYGKGIICSCQRFFFNDEIGWNDDCVIAWQPLPEPYKKGGAE